MKNSMGNENKKQTKIYSCQNRIRQQHGFSLFMVLIILVLIALVVIAGVRWTNTETRSSSNSADRQVALSLAEASIREAETTLLNNMSNPDFDRNTAFANACGANGLCRPADANALYWEADNAFTAANSAEYAGVVAEGQRRPRYIIEYMGLNGNQNNINTYRITTRAWGKNDNTQVTIQVYDEMVGG